MFCVYCVWPLSDVQNIFAIFEYCIIILVVGCAVLFCVSF